MAELRISTDPADVDLDVVHGFLANDAYWCPGIPRPVVAKAIAHSLCFSALLEGAQVGFARVIGDRATFAYLADVFVLPAHRGRGIATALMAAIDVHPELQRLRRFMLATADAHALYAGHGFTALARPERFMERYDPQAYLRD
jgi:GNAT superfamily N-acetyltransferase